MKSSANKQENNTTENGKSRKLNYFLIFLVCWLVLVTGFIAWFLLRFNDFAAKYEEQYQASLPYHTAEAVTAHFNAHDVDYIWENMAQKPEVTVFEDETTVKEYVTSLISDKTFVCAEADSSTDSDPEFYVKTSDGLVVAKIILAALRHGRKASSSSIPQQTRQLTSLRLRHIRSS